MIEFLSPLAKPIGFIWLFLCTGTAWLAWKRRWQPAAITGAAAALLYLFGATPLPYKLMAGLEKPYARGSLTNFPVCDAVVMLGGAHRFSTYDTFHLDLTSCSDRILTSLELMRIEKAKVLVLGGNTYSDNGARKPDSNLLRDWFAAWGIPKGPVLDLGRNRNTYDEAVQTKSLATRYGWKRVLLVTSAFHCRRAEGVFRAQGVDVVPVGCDFQSIAAELPDGGGLYELIPQMDGIQVMSLYIHEAVGWYVYKWRGWLKP
jgi:uncharacterized SAM-binding protein YcdF (DUF218 family)